MGVTRVSDVATFAFFQTRIQSLQKDVRQLQEQLVSGRRLLSAEEDPFGTTQTVRATSALAALGRYEDTSRFGSDVLGAQEDALAAGVDRIVRAEEIATQLASGLYSPAERVAAAEEVHGILEELTALGNSELAGRRLFSGLALDAPPPFADPDAPGYAAATAYAGSTYEFEVKIDDNATDRVRVSSRGDLVFGPALEAIEALEAALAAGTAPTAELPQLAQAREVLEGERASIGARQRHLLDRADRVRGLSLLEAESRSRVRDVDIAVVATDLVHTQTALQALLAAAAQIRESSLSSLLQL